MKRNLRKIIGAALLSVSLIFVTTFVFVTSQNKSKAQSIESDLVNGNSGGQLNGTWDEVKTLRNCQTNAAIRVLPELDTFAFGGTMTNSTSGLPQSRRTPGHGVWRHDGGNNYTFSYKAFTFDGNGNYTGWLIVRQWITLDQARNQFSARGTAEFYDVNGNLLSAGCSSSTATRFE